MKFSAIIPARRDSKRLKNKNTKVLNGKPMIFWTIEAAIKSKVFKSIFISTNDEEIKKLCREFTELKIINRPEKLSLDNTTSDAVIRHALEFFYDEDCFVLLQPTSPLRLDTHISQAIKRFTKQFNKEDHGTLISVSNRIVQEKWSVWVCPETGLVVDKSKISFQNCIKKFLNGAIYINKVNQFKSLQRMDVHQACVFEMPAEFSFDVDELSDFNECQKIMTKHKNLFKEDKRAT